MENMKTKQQIIDRVKSIKEKAVNKLQYDIGSDLRDLERELSSLPDFNPNRIDEERFKELWGNKSLGYNGSMVQQVIQEYNSTLPSPLVPLPKEIPELLKTIVGNKGIAENVWNFFRHNYGTPEKQPLPSVEELERELSKLWGKDIEMIQKGVAKYLHSKYSLPPKQEDVDKLKEELENERIRHAACGTAALGYFTGCHEKYLSASLQDVINLRLKYEGLLNKQEEEKVFPFNLKEGDKFKWEKEVQKFKKFRTYLVDEDGITYLATTCTPYIPPTAQDIIAKHNLTDEEVKVIKEGK
jgi:hypothetical protein